MKKEKGKLPRYSERGSGLNELQYNDDNVLVKTLGEGSGYGPVVKDAY